jgi:hypothetical protein
MRIAGYILLGLTGAYLLMALIILMVPSIALDKGAGVMAAFLLGLPGGFLLWRGRRVAAPKLGMFEKTTSQIGRISTQPGKLSVMFCNPIIAEATSDKSVTCPWEPKSTGWIEVGDEALVITGSNRLSLVERWLSLGPIGRSSSRRSLLRFARRLVLYPISPS